MYIIIISSSSNIQPLG